MPRHMQQCNKHQNTWEATTKSRGMKGELRRGTGGWGHGGTDLNQRDGFGNARKSEGLRVLLTAERWKSVDKGEEKKAQKQTEFVVRKKARNW